MYKEFLEKYKEDIKKSLKELRHKETFKNQIPNLLTASRLLAPFFIIPAAFSGNVILAVLFTGLFEATDALDGFAARKLNAVSEFGKDLDPIVDKIFAATMALPIIFVNPLILGNILGEAYIAKINTDSKLKGNVPRTTVLGKLKTALLSLTIGACYFSVATGGINPLILSSILLSTGAVQLATAVQYKRIDKEKEEEKKNESNDELEESNTIVKEESTFEKIKKYSRANEISELKKLKEELLNKNSKTEEKNKVKTKK